MRVAQQAPTSAAAKKADRALAKNRKVMSVIGDAPVRATMACEFGSIRGLWFDDYVAQGGEYIEICNERMAPFRPDKVTAQVADKVFFARHPQLKQKPLTAACDHGALRSEWMDLYVEYGGRVAEICSADPCKT